MTVARESRLFFDRSSIRQLMELVTKNRTVVEAGQFLKDGKTMYERCTRLSDHFSEGNLKTVCAVSTVPNR